MASKKSPNEHQDQIQVSIEQAQLEVIPAVHLEQKEIKMTFMKAESVPTSAKDVPLQAQGAEKIVGKKVPSGEGRKTTTDLSTELSKTSATIKKPATVDEPSATTGKPPAGIEKSPAPIKKSPAPIKTSPAPIEKSGVPELNGHHEKEKEEGRLSVGYSPSSPKRSDSQVMEFIEQQEKSLQEQFRSLPRKPKKPRSPRSPSPSPVRQSIGLDHLDNLVRLMEQLTNLRDENSKLKKRCAYLESTKYLLQVKSDLATEGNVTSYPSSYRSLPSRRSSKRKKDEDKENDNGVRRRVPSAEDVQCLEVIESCSDQSPKRPKHAALHKRSFSTGSLEIPSDVMEQSGEDEGSEKILSKSYDKGIKPNSKSSKSTSAKHKSSKTSKWARVKKVISGPKLEDIRFSLRSFKGGHARYPASGTHQELTVPSVGITESRSVDSGVGSGLEAESHEGRGKLSSGGPPSPSAYQTKHPALPELRPREDELCTEIWMGPPGWLEKHEKEQLESPREHLGTEITSDMLYSKILTHKEGEMERYLTVPLTRRKSSPSLVDEDLTDDSLDAARLHRSSSYKDKSAESEGLEQKDSNGDSPKSDKEKKYHRTAWGKVKDMIHTRKDSLKRRYSRKPGKSEADHYGEELSEVDIEISEELDEDHSLEGPLGRSTPKMSPIAAHKNRDKSLSNSPPGSKIMAPRMEGGGVDVAALLGGVSDDFSKKLAEWEELRSKRSSQHGKEMSGGTDVVQPESMCMDSPEFEQPVDDWERPKDTASKPKLGWNLSGEGSPDPPSTPPESQNLSVNLEEMQRKLTESFSRKLEEWERIKYRKEGSPSTERKESSSRSVIRKEERQKSKKSKGEKEKEKMARMRERELQRVEREQQKLEKERIRLEKERLKALEREARIEKMKGRLSQSEIDTKFKNPILSPLAECKVTSEFARKLHEWEIMKGLPYSASTAVYLEAQQRSMEKNRDYQPEVASSTARKDNGDLEESFNEEGQRKKPKGKKPPPLMLQQCIDSPEDTSPLDRMSDISFGDDTTATNESISHSSISRSLEKANERLLEELHFKEQEYSSLQTEVEELNEKLMKVKEHHSKEINQMKKDQLAGSPTRIAVDQEVMTANLLELEEKIVELQGFGERLAASMESAAICKWQSIEGEESVNARLIELMEQMRLMLLQASQSDEVSQQDSAMRSYEKLYNQSMQLQVQMNNLRLSQLERNKEIVDMKRQLLLQEANNLLLQADITRRESELHQFHDGSRRGAMLKRWNTYSGMEEDRKRIMKSMGSPRKLIFSFGERDDDNEESSASDKDRKPSLDEEMEYMSDVAPLIQSDDVFERVKVTESTQSCSRTVIDQQHQEHSMSQRGFASVFDPPKMEGGGAIVEICTVSLPTASVVMPRDISQHELSVPRSRHSSENTPPSHQKNVSSDISTHVESDSNIIESEDTHKNGFNGSKTELRFPELLIPQWRKTPERAQVAQECEGDIINYPERPDHSLESDSTETPTLDQSFDSLGSSSTTKTDNETSSSSKKATPHVLSKSHANHQSFEKEVSKPETMAPFPLMRLSDSIMSEKLNKPSYDLLTQSERRKLSEGNCKSEPELRNTPELRMISPTPVCHLPPVSPTNVRRVQPAKEILQESRKYRSGHSIYMTRILQKKSLREDLRKCIEDRIRRINKENVAEGYVQKMVERLSREGTPENGMKAGDLTPKSLSLHRKDSPKSQSEFIQQIVNKLSSPSGPEHIKAIAPLKDVTNDGKVRKLAEAFDSGSSRGSPERTILESDYQAYRSVVVTSKRKSCEFYQSYDSSSSTSTLTFTHSLSTTSHIEASSSYKPEPTISATNCSSMPLINLEGHREMPNGHRERSATCSSSHEQAKGQSGKEAHVVYRTLYPGDDFTQIDILSEGSQHSSTSSKYAFPKTSPSVKRGEVQSPKTSPQKGFAKIRMGTIGALCKQTMSFDLGISLQKHSSKTAPASIRSGSKHQKQSSNIHEGKDIEKLLEEQQKMAVADVSPQSSSKQEPEIMVGPSSVSSDAEQSPTSSDEKKKSRSLGWLQKPKRFFKISKCQRCCPKPTPDERKVQLLRVTRFREHEQQLSDKR